MLESRDLGPLAQREQQKTSKPFKISVVHTWTQLKLIGVEIQGMSNYKVKLT